MEDSVLQFTGNISEDISYICLQYLSEFHVKYLICSSLLNKQIDSDIEEVLHDILTNGGVKYDANGNVIGFKYVITYEFLPSLESILEAVKQSKFAWIYRKE